MTPERRPIAVVVVFAAAALVAPLLAPRDPSVSLRDHVHAPPTPIRVRDSHGQWRPPFFYPQRLLNRLERRYREDRDAPADLVWLRRGLVAEDADADAPFLLLGADGSGRDVWARLLAGTRTSLGIAFLAVGGALGLGLIAGGIAGAAGGRLDAALMRFMDVLVVLPALYVVVALRAALPLVLPPATVALLVAVILALVGAPWFARGVRAILAAERTREYVEAARAIGASRTRVLIRHLLPATRGFVLTQAVLLLPAFVVAEATLSFIGLGLPDTLPSWGTALQEAADVTALAAFPWLLAPAAAIVLVTLAANLAVGGAADAPMSAPVPTHEPPRPASAVR